MNSRTGTNLKLIGLEESSKGEAEMAGVGGSVGARLLCKHTVMM